MDENFIAVKTIFALIGASVIFGIILLANSSLESVWGVAKLTAGSIMIAGGILFAVLSIRRV